MRFFQGFPLFFSEGRAKYARLLHHAYFPTPVPTPLSYMPYRGLCYLNALPVMHLFPATGYLVRDGRDDLMVRTNQASGRVCPSLRRYNVSAPSGLMQRITRDYPKWKIGFPFIDERWNSLSPGKKEHVASLVQRTPPVLYERPQGLYLNLQDGSVSSYPVTGNEFLMPGKVGMSPVNAQRIRVRDYCPEPHDGFWDFAGLYEWTGLRKEQVASDPKNIAQFIARKMMGCQWHQLTILFHEPEKTDEGFIFRPRYMADPYSVILYALRHEIIPHTVWENDFQLDRRVFNFPEWSLYEDQRRNLITKINPRLVTLMEALYADRPASLPPRRNRNRSGYKRGLRELSNEFRDNR